jgi:hypothetical protein
MSIRYYGANSVSSGRYEFFEIEEFTESKDSDALLASVSGNGRKKGALFSGEKILATD